MAAVCRRAGVDTQATRAEAGGAGTAPAPVADEVPGSVRGVLSPRIDPAMEAAEP
jgi:hypothetical protein